MRIIREAISSRHAGYRFGVAARGTMIAVFMIMEKKKQEYKTAINADACCNLTGSIR